MEKLSSEIFKRSSRDLVWSLGRYKLLSTHTRGVQLQHLLERLYLPTLAVLSSVCVHMEIND